MIKKLLSNVLTEANEDVNNQNIKCFDSNQYSLFNVKMSSLNDKNYEIQRVHLSCVSMTFQSSIHCQTYIAYAIQATAQNCSITN